MPRFRIVGRHSQALFHSGLQFVKKVRIDSNAGGDNEVATCWFTLEAYVSQMTKRNLTRLG
jgi:hypothetical protein